MLHYIIVGQGLAGTLLAWFLEKAGKSFVIIDNQHQGASSAIAAGIINPVTGKRFVKSWMIDDLLPFAKETYLELEKWLGVQLYHERNILRILTNAGEENDWMARCSQPDYQSYLIDKADASEFADRIHPFFGYGEIKQAAQVDLPDLIRLSGHIFENDATLIAEKFDFSALHIEPDRVHYKSWSAEKIIFCEGYQAIYNPYFKYLPFNPDKGELLLIKIPGNKFSRTIKLQAHLVPLKNNLYWAGSTNQWTSDSELPTESEKQFLLKRIHEILNVPFEIIDHQAAIRPTVRDRRPFLGLHPDFPGLAIFNGLGTKGASLGPYWAKKMCDFLANGAALPDEVNINRFSK